MTQLELNSVSRSFQVARKLLDEVKPVLDALNIIYDSDGGAKETITQDDLDGVPSFSDLTKAQLDDGMWAMTATIRSNLASAYSAIAQLAARA